MKIVIDKDIPFIAGVFDAHATTVSLDCSEIVPKTVRDADVLIVRSRTKCGRGLLEGSKVKMIATAGIGTDHINLDYCRESGIFVQNSAGCNAVGVMNYVCSALFGVAARKSIALAGATMGIVGMGDTGSSVAQMARHLGMKVLGYDPLKSAAEKSTNYCELNYLLRNSDIVSLHIPLNRSTYGMADAEFFSKMKLGAIFINTSRGGIVNERDLLASTHKLGPFVIDTWTGEPDINRKLLEAADIATPHIAGYSYKSKLRSTSMAVKSVARFLKIEDLYDFYPTTEEMTLPSVKLDTRGKSQGEITSMIQYNYPIFTDDFLLRMAPERFAELRANYKYRREFYFE